MSRIVTFEDVPDVPIVEQGPGKCRDHPTLGQPIFDVGHGSFRCSACLRRLPSEYETRPTPRSMVEGMKQLGIEIDEDEIEIDEQL